MDLPNINKDRQNRRKSSIDLASMVYGKVPPQVKELEVAVLGALLLEPDAILRVSNILKPEHFYVDAHQRIYNAILSLDQKNQKIDILLVVEELKFKEELDLVGGPYYVTRLNTEVVSTASIEAHAHKILQSFAKRNLIRIFGEGIGEAYEDRADFFEIMDQVYAEMDLMMDHINNIKHVDYKSLIQQTGVKIINNDGSVSYGIPSGMPALDRIILGWIPGQLYVGMSRPGGGKTATAVQLVHNISKTEPVHIFELETKDESYAIRHLANVSGIPTKQLRQGGLNPIEQQKLRIAMKEISERQIFSDFTSEQNLHLIKHKIRASKKKNKCRVFVIDYIQIITTLPEHEKKTREQQVSLLAYGLAAIAKDEDVVIIVFAQQSREIEKRAVKKPTASDLRESGGLEAAARVVFGIHRPEQYGETVNDSGESIRNIIQYYVLKNNEGDTGMMEAWFAGHISRITDLELMDNIDRTVSVDTAMLISDQLQGGFKKIVIGDKFGDPDIDDDTPF